MQLEVDDIKKLVADDKLTLKIKEATHRGEGLSLFCVSPVNVSEVYLMHDAWLHLDVKVYYPDGWPGWFKTYAEAEAHIAVFQKRIRRHGVEVDIS